MYKMKTDLKPIHDSRESFYGKATVETHTNENGDTVISLYSYNTLVAYIVCDQPHVLGTYSNTTLRHIKEFLKQNGFKAENKQQIVKDYIEVE